MNVDIKPGSCPNSLNLGSKGVLPVAILGTDDFDVTEVDMATVELVGVSPLRGNIEDVATPIGSPGDPVEDCHDLESDGLLDLSLKFDNRDIVGAIGCVQSGDVLVLMLTGNLNDGTPIEGEDIIIVRGDSC